MIDPVGNLINFHDVLPDIHLPPYLQEWMSNAIYDWRYRGVPIGIALG